MDLSRLLTTTDRGLYCPAGDFYIDPWRPVDRAVITHAHADHARRGSGRYLCAPDGRHVLQARMGDDAVIDIIEYGAAVDHHGVKVSLHPAGHVLGSAQVRLERAGLVAVVSGDYKVQPDPTCRPFEPVRCHVFVSESTFGLPIYRWAEPGTVFEAARDWWRGNRADGRASVLFAYALGKAQRLMAGIGGEVGPIVCHGAVETINRAYRASGVSLPEATPVGAKVPPGALVVAPPSAQGTPWLRRFGPISTAFASGWMTIRGARRRRSVDRGFILSDHADWPGLLSAIEATGAESVWLTHGYSAIVARWLRDQGRRAEVIATQYEGEGAGDRDEPAETADAPEAPGGLFPTADTPDAP